MKSTPEEIRARFDKDVERFSNLETGQSATIDAPLAMELIAQAAARSTPHATALVDIGCGAGNLSLKVREFLPRLDVTLIDLSLPMLARATERLGAGVRAIQGDIREVPLETEGFDIAVMEVDGFAHPLSAVYCRTTLPYIEDLLARDRLRPAFLFDAVRTRRITAAEITSDPDLRTLRNLNTPEDYQRALADAGVS